MLEIVPTCDAACIMIRPEKGNKIGQFGQCGKFVQFQLVMAYFIAYLWPLHCDKGELVTLAQEARVLQTDFVACSALLLCYERPRVSPQFVRSSMIRVLCKQHLRQYDP
jgi:hypothetical protein